jgi:membrane protein DedA with SNARE-associated domain
MPMMATAWGAVLLADNILYRVGYIFGPRATQLRFTKRVLTPARVAWIEGHFARHGILTLFVARFLPGVRMPTLLVAGMTRMKLSRFLLGDGLAAAITAPLTVWLGYRFGQAALNDIHTVGWVLLGLVVTAVAVLGVRRLWRARRAAGVVSPPR